MASARWLFVLYLVVIVLAVPMYVEPTENGASAIPGMERNGINRRLLQTIDCKAACGERYKEASRQNVCSRDCGSCCANCKCVPPGTNGNQDLCPCYASPKTHGNKPKCP